MSEDKEKLEALLAEHAELISNDEYEVFAKEVTELARKLFKDKHGVQWSREARIKYSGAADVKEFEKAYSSSFEMLRNFDAQELGEFLKSDKDAPEAFTIYQRAAAFDFDMLETEASAQRTVSQEFGYYLPEWLRNSRTIYKFKKNTPSEVLELFNVPNLRQPGLEMTSAALVMTSEAFMSVDHNAHALARFVAGRSNPMQQLPNGFSLLEVRQPRGQRREIAVKEGLPPGVIEIIHPDDKNSALERILNEKNITKAKTFLATLSCASQDGVVPTEFSVMLDDMMRLVFGYERTGPKKTRSEYWHKGVAELIKYLALDLPGLQIHTQVKLPYEEELVIANGYLMHRPVIYTKQALLFDNFTLIASTGSEKDLSDYVRNIEPVSFQLGFPGPVFRAFGALRGTSEANALERVPKEVLALKGTTFWLAYDVAFLRRWPLGKNIAPGKGKFLLRDVLDTIGYTTDATKSGRNTSYKDALKAWLKDVSKLTELGLLDHPGVLIHEYKAGRWYTINSTVEGWIKSRGTKITREKLEELRIVYEIPAGRREELKPSRQKKSSIRQSSARAKAANKARAKASKKAG